jgi:glycosyltransferase involved in cell wall biosynthesis
MLSTPLVSIIIPSYNHSKYIKECIESVINQTYENIELIVIDDGSRDDSTDIIAELANRYRFKYYFQSNIGLSATLNRGLFEYVSGDFCSFIASDDKMLPNRIELLVKKFNDLANGDVAAIYSDGYLINEHGQRVDLFSRKYPLSIWSNVHKSLIIENWIGALSLLFRTSCLKKIGGFDASLKVEDYDMLLRISFMYQIVYLDAPLFEYRWHGANFSVDETRMKAEFAKIVDKHQDLKRYTNFKSSILKYDILKIIKYSSFNNWQIFFFNLLRLVQIKLGLSKSSISNIILSIIKKTLSISHTKFRIFYYKLSGLHISWKMKLIGSIKVRGRRGNINIGSNVYFLGKVNFIVDEGFSDRITISNNVKIEDDVTLYAHGGNIFIGDNCFIGHKAHIQGRGGVEIGADTMIAPGVRMFASNHNTFYENGLFNTQGENFKGIKIGDNCWIGANVTILDGTVVGDNCIVAAQCVLAGNYKDGSKIVAKDVKGRAINE